METPRPPIPKSCMIETPLTPQDWRLRKLLINNNNNENTNMRTVSYDTVHSAEYYTVLKYFAQPVTA